MGAWLAAHVVLCLAGRAAGLGQPTAGVRRAGHVVVFGVDGLGAQYLTARLAAHEEGLPTVRRLLGSGLHTHNCRSVFPAISAPNWLAVLRSATPTESGVPNNLWDPSNAHLPDINTRPDGRCATTPDVFTILRAQQPNATTALLAGWTGLTEAVLGPRRHRNHTVVGGGDMEIAVAAGEYFAAHGPDFMFVQLNEVDETGHAHGYGAAFDMQVEAMDQALGRFISTVEDTGRLDRTLVVFVSDHGRTASGRLHGDFKLNQLQTTLILWGGVVPSFRQGKELVTPVLVVDIPSTALFALGYDQPLQWRGRAIKELFLEDSQLGWYYAQADADVPANCAQWRLNEGEVVLPTTYILGVWNGLFVFWAVMLLLRAVRWSVWRWQQLPAHTVESTCQPGCPWCARSHHTRGSQSEMELNDNEGLLQSGQAESMHMATQSPPHRGRATRWWWLVRAWLAHMAGSKYGLLVLVVACWAVVATLSTGLLVAAMPYVVLAVQS